MDSTKPKNKGGRPRKPKEGARLWIPGDALDLVKSTLKFVKEQSTNKGPKS